MPRSVCPGFMALAATAGLWCAACGTTRVSFLPDKTPAANTLTAVAGPSTSTTGGGEAWVDLQVKDTLPIMGGRLSFLYNRIGFGVADVELGDLFPHNGYDIVPPAGHSVLEWAKVVIDQQTERLDVVIAQDPVRGRPVQEPGLATLLRIRFYGKDDWVEDSHLDVDDSTTVYNMGSHGEESVYSAGSRSVRTGTLRNE